MRGLVKGKRWLLLTRWTNLDSRKKQLLNDLFRIYRRYEDIRVEGKPRPALDLHI
jgi:hypothetical protein